MLQQLQYFSKKKEKEIIEAKKQVPYKRLNGNERTEKIEMQTPLDGLSSREEVTEVRINGAENR